MRFEYVKLPAESEKKFIELPLIPIKFDFGGSCFCLIDSGADKSYLDAKIGEILNIDIKRGIEGQSSGITGHKMIAYFHKINFNVGGWDFIAEFGFVYNLGTPFGILGREEFFNIFEVKFNHPKRFIELKQFNSN